MNLRKRAIIRKNVCAYLARRHGQKPWMIFPWGNKHFTVTIAMRDEVFRRAR